MTPSWWSQRPDRRHQAAVVVVILMLVAALYRMAYNNTRRQQLYHSTAVYGPARAPSHHDGTMGDDIGGATMKTASTTETNLVSTTEMDDPGYTTENEGEEENEWRSLDVAVGRVINVTPTAVLRGTQQQKIPGRQQNPLNSGLNSVAGATTKQQRTITPVDDVPTHKKAPLLVSARPVPIADLLATSRLRGVLAQARGNCRRRPELLPDLVWDLCPLVSAESWTQLQRFFSVERASMKVFVIDMDGLGDELKGPCAKYMLKALTDGKKQMAYLSKFSAEVIIPSEWTAISSSTLTASSSIESKLLSLILSQPLRSFLPQICFVFLTW